MKDAPILEDTFVVLYGVPWKTYRGISDALDEYHTRHTYDCGTLELRSVLYGVSWESYMAFVEATGDYKLRHTYDQGTLEMMSPRKSQEWDASLLGRLIERMAEELEIRIQSVGSTTFFRALGTRGLQPDRSYYVANEPRVRGREEFDPETDPPPDLVVEVDLTSSSVDRMPVYATLRVPELWRYSGKKLTFYGLARGGKYASLRHSKAFKFLRPADLTRFLDMRHDTDENSVIRAFVAWLRQKHAPPPKKNPRKS
jgi:Uma2 family endonuclease